HGDSLAGQTLERDVRRHAVIARYWSARTSTDQAPLYFDHLSKAVVPELKALKGFKSCQFLQRNTGSGVEVVVITFWESLNSIMRFAGDDVEAAVVADKAAQLLTDYDRRVKHYEVTSF